jgi:hypothetical protein
VDGRNSLDIIYCRKRGALRGIAFGGDNLGNDAFRLVTDG